MLRDENSSEHPHDSSVWKDMIDRGGLWHVKDIVYPVFYAMEEEMRRQVHQLSPQHPTLDVKNLQDLLTKNEDVLFYWAMASMEFHNEDDTLILKKIVKLWITVRGFAFVSGWMEKYKQDKITALQKKKALREEIQN
eukprot:Em0092g6a